MENKMMNNLNCWINMMNKPCLTDGKDSSLSKSDHLLQWYMDPGLTFDVKASIAWALGSHRSLRDNQLVVIGTCRDPCRDQNESSKKF